MNNTTPKLVSSFTCDLLDGRIAIEQRSCLFKGAVLGLHYEEVQENDFEGEQGNVDELQEVNTDLK